MKKALILCSLSLLLFSSCSTPRTLKYRVPPVDYEQHEPVYK